MNRRSKTCAAAIVLAVVVAAPRLANADERTKETVMTFSSDVALPGKVLPAGTYVFRLADANSTRHIVQVFDRDLRLLATCFTIAAQRGTSSNGTSMVFVRRGGMAPAEIRQWYYPGEHTGEEFVYAAKPAR